MSRRRSFPKTLVVEGKTDVYAVASLVKYFVDWPDSERPVEITALNGADRLDAGLVEAVAFAATRIGFILDADVDASSRYSSVRHQIGNYCPGLPANMPSGGAIADGPDGRKWGIWIMPDNRNPGGVETFLSRLVAPGQDPLWRLAEESVARARLINAPFRNAHRDQAQLYTWLAWQDKPGQSLGVALQQRTLDPASEHAQPFIQWMMRLFGLTPRVPAAI